ncbi:MAG: DUF3772 domain-containing protein [Paracoccaceae bacterium]
MQRIFAILLLLLVAAMPGMVLAQDSNATPNYEGWEVVAQRAENATQARRASNTALDELREELVTWRDVFLAAQDINSARISTLGNQLSALGQPPEDAGSEPAELTLRRAELGDLLAVLQTPRKQAEEAHSRADGLISETDTIIRDRQTAGLIELKPSPLNPGLWSDAWQDISGSARGTANEVKSAIGSAAFQVQFWNNAVLTLAYGLLAFVLLFRGRFWMVRATGYAQRTSQGARGGLRGFLVSLGQVVLPGIGIYAFVEALFTTGVLGFRGQLIADGLIPMGLAFFTARWLALRLLPRGGNHNGYLQIDEADAQRVRVAAGLLGLLWGGNQLVSQLADFERYSQATRVVLHFPFIAICGVILFRLGRILHRSVLAATAEPNTGWSFRHRTTDILGRALIVVGVGAPLAAAVGFHTGAVAVVFPSILSLALLALVVIIAAVLRDMYGVLTGKDQKSTREALIPILVSFVLVLASTPLFALIWGARLTDLTELWTKFLNGYQLGETRISPTDFLTFAIVFVIGYMLTRLMQSTLRTSVLPKTSINRGAQTAILSGLGYVGVFLAALVAITTAGIDLSSLAIVAGALSVGIGFGLQNIVSNFVSGVILLIERPISEGDWIEVGGYSGTVRDISVRSTRIETFDRTDVIIPNADLVSGAVTNYTRGNLIGRAVISVGVAYGSDTPQVHELLLDIAKKHPMVSLNPGPSVHLVNFGADSLDFQVRAILRDVNFILTVKSEIHHEIVRRFAEEGIEIPFAQRDVWLRNPEVLANAATPSTKGKSGDKKK